MARSRVSEGFPKGARCYRLSEGPSRKESGVFAAWDWQNRDNYKYQVVITEVFLEDMLEGKELISISWRQASPGEVLSQKRCL